MSSRPLDAPGTLRSPQTSPRATDVPRTSKHSQAPQMSLGPTEPPIPGRFRWKKPPGAAPRGGEAAGPGGTCPGTPRAVAGSSAGRGRGGRGGRGGSGAPPVNHPPGMCPDARVQRRDGSGGTGEFRDGRAPPAPTAEHGRARGVPREGQAWAGPQNLPGGDTGGCTVPPAPCRGQEGCRGGYPGFPEAANPPREPPESGKRREPEPERAGGSLPVPPGVALGTLPGLGLLQGRSTRGSSWDSAGAVPPSPASPEPPATATATIIIIKFSVAFVTPATAADTSSATTNVATNSIPVLTATPALRSGIPVPFPVPCPALTPSRPNPVPVPISV